MTFAEINAASEPPSDTPVLSTCRPSALCWRLGVGRRPPRHGSFPGRGCSLAGWHRPPGVHTERDCVLCLALAGRVSQFLTGESLERRAGACDNVGGRRSARTLFRPEPLASDTSEEGVRGCPQTRCCREHLESTRTLTGAWPVSTHIVRTTTTWGVSAQHCRPWGLLGLCWGPSWAPRRVSSTPGPHPWITVASTQGCNNYVPRHHQMSPAEGGRAHPEVRITGLQHQDITKNPQGDTVVLPACI